MTRRWVPPALRRLRRRIRALDRLDVLAENVARLERRLDGLREEIGRAESRRLRAVRGTLQDHEFRVYSQNGEDGIIQFLIQHVPIASRTFVEFGVQDYTEANTRFLLGNDGWSGLVMDGDPHNVERIRADPRFWMWDLTAVAAFVTRENVNDLLSANGFNGDIGLLSIDVDGNDYWIFDAIERARPAIAIVEYNHRFGPTRSVTIPYDPGFVRRQDDETYLASGASLAAIVAAAKRKGLAFVGCNSFGNNAFFVRDDLRPEWLPRLSAEEGYVAGRFREPVLVDGRLQLLTREAEQAWVARARLAEVP